MAHVDRPSRGSVPLRDLHEVLDLFVPATPRGGPEPDGRRRALEVHQLWGALLLQTHHVTPTVSDRVTIGSATGHRWSLLGVDIAWVSEAWRRVLPALPPMWSEVRTLPRTDFAVASLDEHELFTWDGEGWGLRLRDGWSVHADGPVDRDGSRIRLPDRGRIAVDVEGGPEGLPVTFVARIVPEGQRLAQRSTHPPQWGLVAMLCLVGFVGGLFALGTWMLPAPPGLSLVEYEERFPLVRLETPPPEPEVEPTREPDEPEAEPEVPEESAPPRRPRRDRKAEDVAQMVSDRAAAESAGIAGSLDEMLGDGGFDIDTVQIGGSIGVRGGPGGGGLASRGAGFGSGGSAVAGGGLGTRGIGGGSFGFGKRPGKPKSTGLVSVQDPVYLGAIDKALVDDVVQRHFRAIRYCYLRELQSQPSLGGKVVVKFVIARDGGVSSAHIRESSLGSPPAESCIAGQFLRMRFPAPRGGGIVLVSYPFLFSAG